jgi:hypothetical protein
MRMPGKKNIRKEGNWLIDLSCFHALHDTGMLVAFHFAPDGSYEGKVLEGYPQFDPDPAKSKAQVQQLKCLLEEAGETLEKALSSNLH